MGDDVADAVPAPAPADSRPGTAAAAATGAATERDTAAPRSPAGTAAPPAPDQGLTLDHISAQREHFLSHGWGALLVSVTKTAQVEQRCGRVSVPAPAPDPAAAPPTLLPALTHAPGFPSPFFAISLTGGQIINERHVMEYSTNEDRTQGE